MCVCVCVCVCVWVMTSELPDFKDLLPSDDSDNDDTKVTAADVRLLFNPSAPEPPDEFDPEYARASLLALEQRVVAAGRPPIAVEGRRILMEGPLKKKGTARGRECVTMVVVVVVGRGRRGLG